MDFFKKAQELVKPAGDGAASGDGGIAQFASSFMSSNTAPAAPAPEAGAPPAAPGAEHSYQELYSSAQVVYQAASGKEKADYGVLAGAGSDLLEGLATHTNLDQGAFGSYLTKAEGYLDSYHKSHTAPKDVPAPAAPPPAPAPAAAPPAPEAPPAEVPPPAPQ